MIVNKFEKGQMKDHIQCLSTYPTFTEVQKPLLMFNYIIKWYCMLGQKNLSCSVIQTMKNEQKQKNYR